MPTWVWVALLALLCLSVGLSWGVLHDATLRAFSQPTPLPGWSTPPPSSYLNRVDPLDRFTQAAPTAPVK